AVGGVLRAGERAPTKLSTSSARAPSPSSTPKSRGIFAAGRVPHDLSRQSRSYARKDARLFADRSNAAKPGPEKARRSSRTVRRRSLRRKNGNPRFPCLPVLRVPWELEMGSKVL